MTLRELIVMGKLVRLSRVAFWAGRILWQALLVLALWAVYTLGMIHGQDHKPAPVVHLYTNCPAIPEDAEPVKESI